MLVSPGEMHFYKRLCHSLKKVDGLPVYQVDHNYLAAIKKRVNIARDVDKLSHKIKKVNIIVTTIFLPPGPCYRYNSTSLTTGWLLAVGETTHWVNICFWKTLFVLPMSS